jgi:hypothetical protein
MASAPGSERLAAVGGRGLTKLEHAASDPDHASIEGIVRRLE